MNESPIILEGVNLMLLGMGFVACFLALLVVATQALSKIAIKLQPPAPSIAATPGSTVNHSDDLTAVAISAALHHHKKKLLNNS